MKLKDVVYRLVTNLGTVTVTFEGPEATAEIESASHWLVWKAERKDLTPLAADYSIPPTLENAEWFAAALTRSLRE